MSELERIRKVCDWLIFAEFAQSDSDLAQKLGYAKSSLSQILNGKVPLSEKFINRVCYFNKNINRVWILNEEGDMLLKGILKDDSVEKVKQLQEQLNDKAEIILYQKKEIASLQKKLQDYENKKL
ncbi:transcriptional regulator [Flavobacterium sp. ABG]|uniref:transcriptional regulator n=1 Tax=Flavobacterium sp. ABG TaxID=1423322 RepID=UPI00064B391F|nr:transcriptional regulator [Flavobacterium sp. ABG]KLT67909.1 hypothetical protein AB674_19970 [Flavobacterium sp. ABG]